MPRTDQLGSWSLRANSTLMARRTAVRPALMAASWSSPVLLDSCHPSEPWLPPQGSRSDRVRPLALKIQGMGPWAVVLLSAGVSIANPKNLVVLLGAGFIA